jgi:hypothetical protein
MRIFPECKHYAYLRWLVPVRGGRSYKGSLASQATRGAVIWPSFSNTPTPTTLRLPLQPYPSPHSHHTTRPRCRMMMISCRTPGMRSNSPLLLRLPDRTDCCAVTTLNMRTQMKTNPGTSGSKTNTTMPNRSKWTTRKRQSTSS